MQRAKKEILVYAHWQSLSTPTLMGILQVTPVKGKEVFSFEYAPEWIQLPE